MKKILITIVVIVLLGGGAFMYFTRPVQESAQNVQSVTETLPARSSNTDEHLYRIAPESSKASFAIHEELKGEAKTAQGVTAKIAGDFSVTTGNAPQVVVGILKIDATSFKTDSEKRDGAIVRLILQSDKPENQYIVFKATSISNLPASLALDQGFTFDVVGDLTISGVTKPATFSVSAKATKDGLAGSAEATIKRSDYNLTIPNIPFVANVSDSFSIKANIAAEAVKE